MKLDVRVVFIAAAIALAACSGNFGTGTGYPQTGGIPPVEGPTPMPPVGQNGLPQNGSPMPGASGSPSPGTYAITDAKDGFNCPATSANYACVLKFNLPPPTPTPKPNAKNAKSSPTPSPSPTPTPTPSPEPSGSDEPNESPTPSPTPAVTVSLKAESLPKDAPAMVHMPANTLDVVPLMMVTLTMNGGDFPLDGYASAQFTLPQSETQQRGFALQLFQETTSHKKTNYTPVWTFNNSTLNDMTVTFNFQPPKMTITKGSTYALVLYGDDKSKVSPSPSPTASPSASPSASASPSPAPSVSPT